MNVSYTGWVLLFPLLLAIAGCSEAEAEYVDPQKAEEEAGESAKLLRGVPLGFYEIQDVHPEQGTKNTISLLLYGSVRAADSAQAEEYSRQREHTIRDQVITAVRVMQDEEFDDPGLDVLRHRIQLRLRRALPQLPLQDVLATEFSYSVKKIK